MIYTVKFDRPAVYQKSVTFDLDRPETYALFNAASFYLVVQVVQFRSLITPLNRRQAPESHFSPLAFRFYSLFLADAAALKRECHFPVLKKVCLCGGKPRSADLSGYNVYIAKIISFRYAEQYIPEDSVIAKHVLVLEVCAVAPSAHHDNDLIYPVMQIRGDIEFSSIVRTFRVSDIMPIHINVCTARYSKERKHVTPFRSVRSVSVEKCPVDACEVVFFTWVLPPWTEAIIRSLKAEHSAGFIEFRNLRRIVWKLVSQIHIKRSVITPELPARRHIYLIVFHYVRIQQLRKERRFRKEPEVPVTVQAYNFR